MAKNFLFIFLFAVFSLNVLATNWDDFTEVVFSDNFSYTGTYASNGWDTVTFAAGPSFPNHPYANLSWGYYNTTTNPGGNFAGDGIAKNIMPKNITIGNDTVLLEFDLYYGTRPADSTQGYEYSVVICNTSIVAGLLCFDENIRIAIGLRHSDYGGYADEISPEIGGCYFSINPVEAWHDVKLFIDKNFYSLYVDGSCGTCCSKNNNLKEIRSIGIRVNTQNDLYGVNGLRQLIDNLSLGLASNASVECPYPSIFCDNFNYDYKISAKNWIPYSYSGIIQDDITPISDQLELIDATTRSPAHKTGSFPTNYVISDSSYVGTTNIAPVFSSEFDLSITQGDFYYGGSESQYVSAYLLKAHVEADGFNISWYALDNSSNFTLLCANCTTTAQYSKLKINTYFAGSNSFYSTSIPYDYIDVYYGTTFIGRKIGFSCSLIENGFYSETACPKYLAYYQFFKGTDTQFYVDNYYVMVGTDKNTPTIESYYTSNFTQTNTSVINTGSGDLFANSQAFWYQLGLRTAASKIIAGFLFIFIIDIVIIGIYLYSHVPPSATVLGFVDLCAIVIVTYLGLIPIWLLILFGFTVFIGFALYLFKSMKSPGD